MNVPDLEIVGLNSCTNGRSCSLHPICGKSVVVGDVLRLVECIVTINNNTETAIKCVKVVDGVDTCTVAYVPRVVAKLEHVQDHLNKFVQVVELYGEAENSFKWSKSHRNLGMASCALLRDEYGRNI